MPMRHWLCRRVPTSATLLIAAASLAGAQGASGRRPAARDEPVVRARSAVVIAGDACDGPPLDWRSDRRLWAGVDSIYDFRQRDPSEGEPATERTVVRVVRDADALYVSVRAYDREPAAVRGSQLRRDSDMDSDDHVTILIDSFRDRRSGFLFRTNPNGAMWDAQLVGTDRTNANWNGLWDVRADRDSLGWTAVFRIPFRTLRFTAGDSVAFGFNVQRFIRRNNEEDLWLGWRRTEGMEQLLAEGEIRGLGQLRRPHSLDLLPYVLGRAVAAEHDSTGARIAPSGSAGRAGLDAKMALTPTLTADVTVNTDFAQVESDRQLINLTRFPLFFPEKREFFLESSGIFDFGSAERAQLFYSRTIGLDTAGNPVPILAGARVTGRSGPFTLGLLDARTGAGDNANDLVVRVKRDLLDRSYVGAMFSQHARPGAGGVAQSGGLDVGLPLVVRGQNLVPSLWIAGTRTPGIAGTPLAFRLAADFPNDLWDNFAALYRIDDGFNPALGFVRRTGSWETNGHVDFQPRPHALGIRRLLIRAPIPEWDIIADHDGSVFDSRTWQTASFEWRFFGGHLENGDNFEINLQRRMDAPTDTFTVFRGVVVEPARYWWTRYELQYAMSAGRAVSLHPVVSWGQFYDGRATEAELSATWRAGGHLIVGSDLSWTEARISAGRFTAVQTAARIEYALTTRTDFLAFVQYNNEGQRADFNLRFHWMPRIGDDIYVVWNSGYSTSPTARYPFPAARSLNQPLNGALVVKAAYRFAP